MPEGADEMDDVVQMTYVDAVSYFEENGFDEPDPGRLWRMGPGRPGSDRRRVLTPPVRLTGSTA